jgi:hypothetical protein
MSATRERLIRKYYESNPLSQKEIADRLEAMEAYYNRVPENQRKRNLGTVIAQLYIAAQHTSIEVSDAACELMEQFKDDPFVKLGFNQEMEKSPYMIRA